MSFVLELDFDPKERVYRINEPDSASQRVANPENDGQASRLRFDVAEASQIDDLQQN
jgi:hypothetical protein